MTVPEGFTVKLFAGEPDVRQPIAMCLDDRGRVWVAEAYCYPHPPAREGGERPHPDLRGHRRRRQVRQAHRLHGGPEPRQRPGGRLRRRLDRGGAVPAVRPDRRTARTSPPARRKSCSTAGATRTRTRRSTPSPGGRTAGSTAATASSPTRASASRARPTTSACRSTPASGATTRRGTSSRCSPTARATRGAWTSTTTARRSSRRASSRTASTSSRAAATSGRRGSTSTRTPTPTSRPSPTTATTSAPTPHGGNNRSDSAGGGHAHCGTMIYLGGAWPAEYRGQMFMGNIHGRRLNVDVLKPQGLRLRRHRTARTSCWPTTPGRGSSTCATAPTATST